MKFGKNIVCLVAVLACLAVGYAASGDTKGEEVLAAAGAYLAAQDSFAFEANLIYNGEYDGQQESLVTDFSVVFSRPNTVAIHVENPEIEIEFYSDGMRLIRHIPEFGQYIEDEEQLAAAHVLRDSGFDLIVPALRAMSEFMHDTPFQGSSKITEVSYVGSEELDGVALHHLHFLYDGSGMDLWVERGDHPRVRRITPDMTEFEKQFTEQSGMDLKVAVTAEIFQWDMDSDVSPRLAFNPPEGTESVRVFQAPQPPMPANQLLGKPAPDFTIDLLDGGSLTLSEKKGKEIVILDFWATWCGPCRIAMPVLGQVSKEMAEQGIRLYGVNLEEDPDTIRAYLEDKGLDITVALDRTGSVSAQYLVTGIPQTVIVDRNGNVAVVHVGLWASPGGDLGPDATEEEFMQHFHDVLVESLRKDLEEVVRNEK